MSCDLMHILRCPAYSALSCIFFIVLQILRFPAYYPLSCIFCAVLHILQYTLLHILRWKPLNSIVQCTHVSHQACKQCNSFCRRYKDNIMRYKVFSSISYHRQPGRQSYSHKFFRELLYCMLDFRISIFFMNQSGPLCTLQIAVR